MKEIPIRFMFFHSVVTSLNYNGLGPLFGTRVFWPNNVVNFLCVQLATCLNNAGSETPSPWFII